MKITHTLYAAVAVLCLCLIPATQVRADSTDTFVYKSGGNTFTWVLPSTPTVTSNDVDPGWAFILPDVSVSENGGPAVVGTMDFFSIYCSGGVAFFPDSGSSNFHDTGVQLFSGTEGSPTFLPGVFGSLSITGNGGGGTPESEFEGNATVPEPSALSLLAIGLALALAAQIVRKLLA